MTFTIEDAKEYIKSVGGDDFELVGEFKKRSVKVMILHKTCGTTFEILLNNFDKAKTLCRNCSKKMKEGKKELIKKKKISNAAKLFEKLMMENPDKFIELDPECDENGRHRVVMSCGHVSKKEMLSILNLTGCKVCRDNKNRFTHAEFESMLPERFKSNFIIIGKYKKMSESIEIEHKTCGKRFYRIANALVRNGSSCNYCKGTTGELLIMDSLKNLGITFEREKKIVINESNHYFDFYLPEHSKFIEFDGEHHFKPVKHWGGCERFKEILERDKQKNEFCRKNNHSLLRIPYWKKEDIKQSIVEFLEDTKDLDVMQNQVTLEDLI